MQVDISSAQEIMIIECTLKSQAFGFGARYFPGRFFVRASIWSNMVGILAAFDIAPTEDGPPEEKYSSGIVSCADPLHLSFYETNEKLM
ncbi:hypothetical protein EDB92DRAFT_2112929, partial [Lactarius akahatsu]